VQYGLLAADDECMTGIVPALKTNHRCGFFRQQVDDLAFTLVAPLRADNNDVFAHAVYPLPVNAR